LISHSAAVKRFFARAKKSDSPGRAAAGESFGCGFGCGCCCFANENDNADTQKASAIRGRRRD
jgi:hypothetical protein